MRADYAIDQPNEERIIEARPPFAQLREIAAMRRRSNPLRTDRRSGRLIVGREITGGEHCRQADDEQGAHSWEPTIWAVDIARRANLPAPTANGLME